MAVDPELVDGIAASVADIYREAETALARLTARHLAGGLDSPTAERKLGGIRALRRSAQSIIAALEADSGEALRAGLADAYRHGWNNALADLPERFFPRSGIGQAARQAAEQSPGWGMVEALASALHRDLGRPTGNILRNVVDAFRAVQAAAAAARILTGAQTRREAAQSMWARLVDRGIAAFVDRAGRRWKLSSYAEMATRTNAQRAATQAQIDRLDTLGVELVYVSDAVQECELCRPWEGKVLRTTPGPLDVRVEHATRDIMVTVEAEGTLDQARAAGLFHPNCRHSISAFFPGVTKVPPGRPDPDGNRARERQREIERLIRKWKEREAAALTDAVRRDARRRVRAAQAAMRDHLARHPDLKRLPYRERIGGGNIPPPGRRGDAAGGLGPPDEPTFDGGPAPAPPSRAGRTPPPAPDRDEARRAGPGQPELEPPPAVVPDPRSLSDKELDAALQASMDPWDQDAFDRYSAEVDRREAERQAAPEPEDSFGADDEPTPEEQQIAALVEQGWDWADAYAHVHGLDPDEMQRQARRTAFESERQAGESIDQAVRRMYHEWIEQQHIAAEDATRGHMLSPAGTAAGIDPISLFSGPRDRARKYASEELKRWWLDNPRLTLVEFRAQVLGRASDQAAAQRAREGGSGREFGL